MRESDHPDFIEALARGLDVIVAFGSDGSPRTLSQLAETAGVPRPTARRVLITLAELGYVHIDDGSYALTPRVLELGTAYVSASNLWALARPHLTELVHRTAESCSIAQLDGSDVVYVARVAVPKLVTLSVGVGTRFPAVPTSLGKVLLAALPPTRLDEVLAEPSRAGVTAVWQPDRREIDAELEQVRRQGWALTDQQLAPAIRSIAAPIRDAAGRVVAAVNINAHAMETEVAVLTDRYLPWLLRAASAISADLTLWESRPTVTVVPDGRAVVS